MDMSGAMGKIYGDYKRVISMGINDILMGILIGISLISPTLTNTNMFDIVNIAIAGAEPNE